MRAKFIVILILIIAVVAVIAQMIRFEQNLRRKNQVTLRIADTEVPLIEKTDPKQLRELASNAQYVSRCKGDYFEFLRPAISEGSFIKRWSTTFIKGVNLGVAIPGDFPASFSATKETYCHWLSDIGAMNANVVRTYTILPPEFYDALAHYNFEHADKPIYIFQGVWADEPPNENYLDNEYGSSFKREIRDLIDLLHGNATLAPKLGHASGVYASDVSAYVAGIILGREWEPTAVHKTNLVNPPGNYQGDFVSAYQATPMEIFLASMMDFTVLYETQVYGWQRPVSFINWLTLDPLLHNSEFILGDPLHNFDDDLESVDIRKFHSSDLFKPGIFSSYHIYPYYPDFIYLDKKYQHDSIEHYHAYLEALKSVHSGIPLLVAEYGLPNSRGNSHYAPSGYDQGGHSELQQATMCGKMTRDIYQTGCAGAIYFEWIDEWFKHNWMVNDYEQPPDRRPKWHDVENAEQNFGILAFVGDNRIIDGSLEDWGMSKTLQTHYDYSYFYLSAILQNFDFRKNDLYISIDTHDPERGEMKLPFSNLEAEGIEYLAHFKDTLNASMLVDDKYGGYTDIIKNVRPPFSSAANDNGVFVRQLFVANRMQVGLTEDTAQSWIYDRSSLYYGMSSNSSTSNADWYWNPTQDVFELRLPWLMLNVGDPSSLQVHDDKPGSRQCETSTTDGFRIKLFITDKKGNLIETLPKRGSHFTAWDSWEDVMWTEHHKLLYDTLQDIFYTLPSVESSPITTSIESVSIAKYYRNAPGAMAVVVGSNLAWYPDMYSSLLNKFFVKAAFAVNSSMIGDGATEWVDENGYRGRRMEPDQLADLLKLGNELVYWDFKREADVMELEGMLNQSIHIGLVRKGNTSMATGKRGTISLSGKNVLKVGEDGLVMGRDLDSALNLRSGEITYLWFERVEPPAQNSTSPFSAINFERYIRISRNKGLWIATPTEIRNYQQSRDASRLQIESRGNTVFLRVEQTKPVDQPHPLTIVLPSQASKLRVSNSLSDGIHEVREGVVQFDAMPGSQIIIEIVE